MGGSDRAKHIDLRQHFVHDAVHAKVLKLEVVRSADNVADIFTKAKRSEVMSAIRSRGKIGYP